MKKVSISVLLTSFLLSACALQPQPLQERILSTPKPTTTTSVAAMPCAAENWKISVTSINRIDLSDETYLIFARIGIENNDSLWGEVNGSTISKMNKSQNSVFLSTKDGTRYGHLDASSTIPLEQLADSYRAMYETTGLIETPLLPPGFVTLGRSINGEARYYNFAFQIPDSQMPASITIEDLQVQCIQSHFIGGNGKPLYRDKTIQLPTKTYNLETDIADVREVPSARRYPNLIGAELVSADWKEFIFITDVSRIGNEIIVIFDFTNFSSHDLTPSFNGYIMGDSRLFLCENDCDHRTTFEPVQPGHTAQGLTWTFTVPEENETNLIFVYVYGGNKDLNEVYRVNLE